MALLPSLVLAAFYSLVIIAMSLQLYQHVTFPFAAERMATIVTKKSCFASYL